MMADFECRTCAVLAAAALADGKLGYVMCGRCQATATVEVPIDDHATEFGTPLLPVPWSVLRGLCHFADVAAVEGQHDRDDDSRAALEWLRQHAGWTPEG